MVFQDLDCAVDRRKKADIVEFRESPDVPLGMEISSGSSSSTSRMVAVFSLPFILFF